MDEALSKLLISLHLTLLPPFVENKRDYDITVFCNSDTDSDEKYEKLTKDAIAERRKGKSIVYFITVLSFHFNLNLVLDCCITVCLNHISFILMNHGHLTQALA